MNKICDYIDEKYSIRDENGNIKNFSTMCKHCPFSNYIGELNWYECYRPQLDRELPEEFEKVIKDD